MMKDAPLNTLAVLQKIADTFSMVQPTEDLDTSAADIAKDFVLAKRKLAAILEGFDTNADNLAAIIELRVYIMNIESEFRDLSALLEKVIVEA